MRRSRSLTEHDFLKKEVLPGKPSQAVEDKIAELLGEGEPAEIGHFGWDVEKATELLKHFRLAEPYQYVLELIQGAISRGATRVEIVGSAKELRMEHNGSPYSREELKANRDALLVGGGPNASVGHLQLARGVQGARALGATRIEVTSGDGGTATRLRIEPPDTEDVVVLDQRQAGTGIVVRRRVDRAALRQLAAKAPPYPEAALVKAGCAHCVVPVFVQGDQVSHGWKIPRAVVWTRHDDDDARMQAGISLVHEGSAALRILRHGVVVAQESLADVLPDGMLVLAIAEALQRDLSLGAVVHDASYEALRERAVAVGGDALRRLAGWHVKRDENEHWRPAYSRRMIRWGLAHGVLDRPSDLKIPVWRVQHASGRRGFASLTELLSAQGERRSCYWTDGEPPPTIPSEAEGIVLMEGDSKLADALGQQYPLRLRNISPRKPTANRVSAQRPRWWKVGRFGIGGLGLLVLIALGLIAKGSRKNNYRIWPPIHPGWLRCSIDPKLPSLILLQVAKSQDDPPYRYPIGDCRSRARRGLKPQVLPRIGEGHRAEALGDGLPVDARA